jgi:hypothetical protein
LVLPAGTKGWAAWESGALGEGATGWVAAGAWVVAGVELREDGAPWAVGRGWSGGILFFSVLSDKISREEYYYNNNRKYLNKFDFCVMILSYGSRISTPFYLKAIVLLWYIPSSHVQHFFIWC